MIYDIFSKIKLKVNNKKHKEESLCFLCPGKSISRILYPPKGMAIIYLSSMLPSGSSELLLTDYQYVFLIFCFVLAPNKDLAVSFWHFCQTYLFRYLNLSVLASLFAPRILRWTAVSRYYFNPFSKSGCSDFPPRTRVRSNHSPC